MNYSVAPDNREVCISNTNIEPSYYKGIYDIPHGTDRYIHVHQLQRNSVDSIATVLNDPQTGPHFVASGTFNSGAINFILPKYYWTITGDGTPDSNTTASLSPSLNYPYGFGNLPAYLDFGQTWDTTTTKSSLISVDVKDSDGADCTDNYAVVWHAPQENFVPMTPANPIKHNVPQLYGSPVAIVRNATQPDIINIPGKAGELDLGAIEQQAGLPVAVVGAGAGGLLLVPEEAMAGPPGWTVIAFQAVAAAASYKLSLSTPQNPGTITLQGTANYAEFCADVDQQVKINGDPTYSSNLPRFKPTWEADDAQAERLPTEQWEQDPYFTDSTATWQGGWYFDETDEQSDLYDVHGYTGHVPGGTKVAAASFKYFLWTCTYTPPTPPHQ